MSVEFMCERMCVSFRSWKYRAFPTTKFYLMNSFACVPCNIGEILILTKLLLEGPERWC